MNPIRSYLLPNITHAKGDLHLPGSKSISNRILLLAALSQGQTRIHGLLDSDDTRVMLAALAKLGVPIHQDGDVYVVQGLSDFSNKSAQLFMGNAGTAIRPLTAALAVLGGEYEVDGVARMRERPIGDLVDALRQIGAQIDYMGQEGYPPLRIGQSSLTLPESILIQGNVSSQFLSAMLMVAPLVAKRMDRSVKIEVVGELISKPYITLTLNLMARFGVLVRHTDDMQCFTIDPQASYTSPGDILVEGDASSASYFMALGLLGGGPIRIYGIHERSIQGDIRFADVVQAMGAQVHWHDDHVEIGRTDLTTPLRGFDLDFNLIPDAAMTAAVLALFADRPCTLRNIASWRVKETDRIEAMKTELMRLGAQVESGKDYLRVYPLEKWQNAAIQTYDDHRMAMCFSLASFGRSRVEILDPECVSKTFPDYFTQFARMVGLITPTDLPIITIDGPSASGKGTVARALAKRLGFHVLESGALYRLTALQAQQLGVSVEDEQALAKIALQLDARFDEAGIYLEGVNVGERLQDEQIGKLASQIAALPAVRTALLQRQRDYAQAPGLVADGRDMGTVVFTQSNLKVFWVADVEVRAQRRVKQLNEKGIHVKFNEICEDLKQRDARDYGRSVCPLVPSVGSYTIDSSQMSIEECVDTIVKLWQRQLS